MRGGYGLYRLADRINEIMGVTISMVITRIMGLMLRAIAVNFIAIGIWNIYRSFL